jgi:anaphase-promoting complex subunit 2
VSSLIDSEESELHGELKQGGSLEYGADVEDEDGGPGLEWYPKKRTKDLQEASLLPSGQDVLAMLVSIYGSTDLFVKEYRALLSERLSVNIDYVSDTEVKNLERLKRRFGEESLHSCEVTNNMR